jgi:DNA repair protein RadA/Sms
MAKKQTSRFVCSQCGSQHLKWQGKCTDCNAWGTVAEEAVAAPSLGFRKGVSASSSMSTKFLPLDADLDLPQVSRVSVGMPELDRVLGGGLVRGTFVLLSGDPGIGKSTLLLQAVSGFAKQGHDVLYVSGEESSEQVIMRAGRLRLMNPRVRVANESNIDSIIQAINDEKPQMLVVDSIQTVFSPDIPSAPGSVTQVRECAAKLLDVAKSKGISIWLVGHVTKDGSIAGPRVLEHLVDCVLYLEGDPQSGYRILRAVKNRFGSTGEIGVFEMSELGMLSVDNPGGQFLEHFSARGPRPSGISTTAIVEGTRPLLVELQALVAKTSFGNPRRVVNGLDANRVSTLLAVLERRSSLHVGFSDVYVSVAGGLRLSEPSTDFAVAVAIASSFLERPVNPKSAFVGEVNLSGSLRSVSHLSARIQEASRMGFERIYVPATSWAAEQNRRQDRVTTKSTGPVIEVVPVQSIYDMSLFLS